MKEINIRNCKVPLCENEYRDGWMFCDECMRNTVRRFMSFEGTYSVTDSPSVEQVERAKYWINFINEHWKELTNIERKSIEKHGAFYDRDATKPEKH